MGVFLPEYQQVSIYYLRDVAGGVKKCKCVFVFGPYLDDGKVDLFWLAVIAPASAERWMVERERWDFPSWPVRAWKGLDAHFSLARRACS